jgi:hypothetical protein
LGGGGCKLAPLRGRQDIVVLVALAALRAASNLNVEMLQDVLSTIVRPVRRPQRAASMNI